jgi:hypothetical protein
MSGLCAFVRHPFAHISFGASGPVMECAGSKCSYHLHLFSSFSCSVLVWSDPFTFSVHFPGEHFVLGKFNPVVCARCMPLPYVCIRCLSALYLLSCESRFFRFGPHVMQFHAKFCDGTADISGEHHASIVIHCRRT